MTLIITLFLSLFCSVKLFAQSGLVYLPTFTHYSTAIDAGVESLDGSPYDADIKESTMLQSYSMTVGYLFYGNFMVGAHYFNFTKTTASESVDASASDIVTISENEKETSSGTALAFGYLSPNLKFTLNYFLNFENASEGDEDGESGFGSYNLQTKREVGGLEAYSMEMAYGLNAGPFSFGPQFTFLKFVYNSIESTATNPATGVSLTSKVEGGFEEVLVIPSLAMWFIF